MAGSVAELKNIIHPEGLAASISLMYDRFKSQTDGWRAEQQERRNFVFATDTSTTAVDSLDWQNTTTLPKLAQIRDNLHANYMSALISSSDWFTWEANTEDAALKKKRDTILAYIKNKVRASNFRSTLSQLIYDYIDFGNAFGDVEYVNEVYTDPETLVETVKYIGPRIVRINPMDLVINPVAVSFAASPKITRTVWTLGELRKFVEDNPSVYDLFSIAQLEDLRSKARGFSKDEFEKADAFTLDGFGSLWEYYQSEFIEILEFEGDIYDAESGEMKQNVVISVAGRTMILRDKTNPSWVGKGTKVHAGWRGRPDNLYAMGPLDNLVGMQYRIDHLQNAMADAIDLNINPPLKIVGEVPEEIVWGPRETINVGQDGDIVPMPVNLSALNISVEIDRLEQKMEEFAGAPREAMGIRSAGEKTAFEVQTLSNAASRIFQEKIENFEINVVEPLLNGMLAIARRELDGKDLVSVMDDDIGVQEFMSITKDDLTAEGKLIPVGARHFAAQQQLTTNLMGFANSPLLGLVSAHLSTKNLSVLIEEVLGLKKFDLFSEFVGIEEQAEGAQFASQIQEDAQVAGTLPPEPVVEGEAPPEAAPEGASV